MTDDARGILAGERFLPRDIAELAYRAGWRDRNLLTAVAICLAESEGYAGAYNDQNPDGSIDRGLMQINSIHIGESVDGATITADALFDPGFNVDVAYWVYRRSSYTFRPWVAYTSGRYLDDSDGRRYMRRSITGVANMWRVRYGVPLV